MSVLTLLLLYIAFRIKHYICDFGLQTNWIAANKGLPSQDGNKALLFHILPHAVGTTLIALAFTPSLWWLGIVDFLVHWLIDKGKAMLTLAMKWKTTDRWFWLTLGFDQELHNFTHLAYMVYMIYYAGGVVL